MIPSMDMFGGWGAFLGVRVPDAKDSLTVGELRKRTQRFPDTASVDYASFLRDLTWNNRGPLLMRQDQSKPLKGTVALVGDGIANLIAAYELSRCGVEVTMFEQRAADPTAVDKPFGGRLATDVRGGYVAELGAKAFPSSSPVFWHYVWRCAVSNGYTEAEADQLKAQRFPSPGVVLTRVCYQDEWFDLTPDLSKLPPIVQEAANLFRAWLRGLNDGVEDPATVYLAEAMKLARQSSGAGELTSFWLTMRRRYNGRSFGSVLGTEVFARGSNPVNLLAAFAAVGVGTGGFGPVYDIACLEVLRQVVWDYDSLYSLPDLEHAGRGDEAGGVRGSKAQAFAQSLAGAALAQSQAFFPERKSEDMFRFGTSVDALCVVGEGERTKIGICLAGKDPIPFDLAIVAISSRAMQALGLGHDATKNPFRTGGTHTTTSRMAVESVQAAVHQLNMISSYKMFARIQTPETVDGWPRDKQGRTIACFVTDRYPRMTYVMPALQGQNEAMAVAAEVWGPDALKFQSENDARRLYKVARSFTRQDPDPKPWPYAVVGETLMSTGDLRERDWTKTVGVGGGVKLDRPGDDYFAASLYYQSQLATEPDSEQRPWGRTFLAGDSVGYLGGWVEGPAMSALTATTAVLYQIRKLNDDREAALRSLELIDRNTPKNHQWTTISRRISALRTWKAMTAVAPCPDWPGKPPTWRWDEVDVKDDISAQPAISQNGRWMVCTALNVHLWREYDQEAGKWDDWRKFTGAGDILNKRISAGPRTPSDPAGTAQVVAITADGELLHCISTNGFDEWGTAITGVGPEAAIAVAPSGSAHVITLRATDSALLYAIRATDGIWTSFLGPPGPPGLPNMKADQLAVAAAPEDDFVMVVVIDKQGTVQAIGRNPNGTWTAWQAARPPADGLKARLVSVACVSRSSWKARVVAKFSDGDLYYSLLDVLGNREQYPWIPLPYPATAEYDTSCLTMGASVDICDPPGSASVWITSQPKRPTGQEKEQGS